MIAPRILIVEDERLIAEELMDRLERKGFKVVAIVSTVESAIRRTGELTPDLVLMDIRLQEGDGIEAAAAIRERHDIPIIYLSAHSDEATVERAKHTAPYGYLLKPFHEQALQITIEMALFKHSLEKKLKEAELREHEMSLAREVQKKCFPKMPCLEGLDIGAVSHPATQASGDYVDVFPIGKNHLAVIVGDVSGHGMPAALLMAESRAFLRGLLRNYSDERRRFSDQIDNILRLLNTQFRMDAPEDYFLTLALAHLSLPNCALEFAGAGHLPGLVLDAAGVVKERLTSLNPPLGVCEILQAVVRPNLMLAPGDFVILFTDGVTEARNLDGVFFGEARLLDVVRTSLSKSAQQMAEQVYEAARTFTQKKDLADDASVLILKLTGSDREPGNVEPVGN